MTIIKYIVPLGLVFRAAAQLTNPDAIGRLPALGWSSWNEYGCDINETVFLETAQLIVDLGLKDLGYQYINIDDCWSDREQRRDPTTDALVVDEAKFPNGIKYVAERVHELGLKLGIYSNAGTSTCAGYEASLGYEDIDAATFASWGIDCPCFVPARFPLIVPSLTELCRLEV
jgi:alpha-galactosidase